MSIKISIKTDINSTVVRNSHALHKMSSIRERRREAERKAAQLFQETADKMDFSSDTNLEAQIVKLEEMLGKNNSDPKKYLIERRDGLLKELHRKNNPSPPPPPSLPTPPSSPPAPQIKTTQALSSTQPLEAL